MKKFNEKIEGKVFRALDKFLEVSKDPVKPKDALKQERFFILENNKVCLIEAISEEAKRVLLKFIDKNYNETRSSSENRIPELDYNTDSLTPEIKCKFSVEYFRKSLSIFNATETVDNSFLIRVKPDYPTTIKNEHFRVIIAPRVSNE